MMKPNRYGKVQWVHLRTMYEQAIYLMFEQDDPSKIVWRMKV